MRIAVTGPESSGKTSLALELAKALDAVYIPEHAREYLLARDGVYTVEDLVPIAMGQQALWEHYADAPVLVSDTEMIVMKTWSEFKYGKVDPLILAALSTQQFDHYFLCYPDIPWEEDPLREHPEQRMVLFELYLRELQERKLPFTIVKGDLEERVELCRKVLELRITNYK